MNQFFPDERVGDFRVEVCKQLGDNDNMIRIHFYVPNLGAYEFIWQKNSGAPNLGRYASFFNEFYNELIYFAYGYYKVITSPTTVEEWDVIWCATKNPKR